MRWLINNKLRWHSDNKHRINWSKKAPSKISQHVKDFLYLHFKNDIMYEEYRLPTSLLRVDFLNATRKFVIEADGKQHNEYVKHFHGNRAGYLNSIKRDIKKDELLENNGYKVIRITDADLPLTKEFIKGFDINF